MEVVVSAEDNAEVRRVSLTNNSTRTREIELTSYAEVVLAPQQADAAHPAFSNLFIETEFFAAENALLAHRRQRSSDDEPIWGVHAVVAEGERSERCNTKPIADDFLDEVTPPPIRWR